MWHRGDVDVQPIGFQDLGQTHDDVKVDDKDNAEGPHAIDDLPILVIVQ